VNCLINLRYDRFVVYHSVFILSVFQVLITSRVWSPNRRFTVDQLLGMELCKMCRACRVNLA